MNKLIITLKLIGCGLLAITLPILLKITHIDITDDIALMWMVHAVIPAAAVLMGIMEYSDYRKKIQQ